MTGAPGNVVIIGGGFGGLEAAKVLGRRGVPVTLVDRRNFHLFQPLLYQVATGGLSPGDISSPLRAVLKHHRRTSVLMDVVVDILPDQRRVVMRNGEMPFEHLILATGVRHSYFGNDEWEQNAPGLKSIEDALEIRRRVFHAFEAAERAPDGEERRRNLTFVVVGGGPTGVELAGALGELAHATLKDDFRRIDPGATSVILIEGTDRILPGLTPNLSRRAQRSLARLGVTVLTGVQVTAVDPEGVLVAGGNRERIESATVLWAAGVAASPLGRALAERTGTETDRAGRLRVRPDLSLPNHPFIHVIGDLAAVNDESGRPLPGTAPVAMQQGRYVARRLLGETRREKPFRYKDKGTLAVIGRNAAVAMFPRWKFSGFPAWALWVFVHILYLIEYDSKFLVLTQWAVSYFTRKRGARLITNEPDASWATDRKNVE
jgi:NADH dehydrogenase